MIFWSSFPFIRLVIPFGVGIYLASTFSAVSNLVQLGALLLLITFISFHFFNKRFKNNYLIGIIVSFLFCLLGALYSSNCNNIDSKGLAVVPEKTTWVGEVVAVKHKKDRIQSLVVQVAKFKKDSLWVKSNFKLLVFNRDTLLYLKIGDVVSGKGKLQATTAPQNPGQFNYQSFLTNKNIYLTTFEDQFVKIKFSNSFIRYAETARASIIEIYEGNDIEGENLAVLIALTLGDKSYLDFELQKQYAGAGAMHILAVSGLHVGIVFLIFNFLLSLLPSGFGFRIFQAIMLLIVIWAFAFLAGLSPSVQRAGWMFSFVIVSKLLKRNSNILNSIAVSAFLLLLIDPNNLFQLGFQLSYSAVVGIVLMHSKIYKLLYVKNWLLDKTWSLLVVSFVAQMATLPFTLAYFHQFPNYFLLANLFVIPLAFAIVSGSVIVVSVYLLLGNDLYLSVILDFILSALNKSIAIITDLPGAVSDGVWLNSVSIGFLFCAIVSFIFLLYLKSKKASVFILCCLVGVQITEFFDTYRQLKLKQITFYALANPTWSVVSGNQAKIYSLSGGRDYDKKMVKDHMYSMGIVNLDWKLFEEEVNQVYTAGNKSILVFPDTEVADELKSEVDFVVQRSNSNPLLLDSVIVVDYYFRKNEQIDSLKKQSSYFNFRKDNALVSSF